MSEATSRIYWPFEFLPTASQSAENQSKLAFLKAAAGDGFQSFVAGDDCGALAGDRETLIIWRGKHRSELLLIERGAIVHRALLVDRVAYSAFEQQAATALDWLQAQPNRAVEPVAGVVARP